MIDGRQAARGGFALVGAAVATGVLGSIVQTQFHLNAVVDMGAAVPVWRRMLTTAADVLRFGPVMTLIAAAGLVPALLVASRLTGALQATARAFVYALAGAVGLWVVFLVMGLFSPMPALVVATRAPGGLAAMCATGLVGGAVFALLPRLLPEWTARRTTAFAGALAVVAALSFLVMAPGSGDAPPAVDPGRYVVQSVATRLDRPWSVAILPDGRRLVTELGGTLRVFAADGAAGRIDARALPQSFRGGEGGLMEVLPDPGFAGSGLLYFSMTYGDRGANGTRIVRARLDGDRLVEPHVLFSSTTKAPVSNNGGRMAWLPDGTLLLTLGDGDTRESAQQPGNHQGSVVRIDRAGRVPADNPFVGREGYQPAIYSLGHRNVQGVAVDADGSVLVSEHGARGGDEINQVRAGGNYGWPVATGGIDYSFAAVTPYRRLAGYEDPLLDWTPSIAPAGLAIYRGGLFPDWQGDLLVPALVERAVRRVIRREGRIVGQELLLADRNQRMRDVKVAPDGSIYVLTDGAGAELLRIVPRGAGGG